MAQLFFSMKLKKSLACHITYIHYTSDLENKLILDYLLRISIF